MSSPSPAAPGNPVTPPRADGRRWCVAILLGYVLILSAACFWFGKSRVLTAAGAPQMSEHFADLSLFAAARHALEQGGDPYLKNTYDPWGRPFNYPRIWLTFMRFPMSWVPAVGAVLILALLGGTVWWLGRLSTSQGLLAGAALCSPPLVLAMERGNCDLVIYLIALLALAALHRGWRAGAWLAVFLAFALKLFPAAGFVIFLREGWRRGWPWIVAGVAATAGYVALQQHEIRTVLHHTPVDLLMSYGSTHWTKVAEHWAATSSGKRYAFHHLEAHSMLWAALLFLGALRAGWAKRSAADTGGAVRHLDAFRLGACLYALTFIAGSSYAYRLVFLLLCLPWLWQKTGANDGFARMRLAALALLFGVLWINSYWLFPLSLGSELCSWALLGVLGWLLGASTPAWSHDAGGKQSGQPMLLR
jgi:hypothetical protein